MLKFIFQKMLNKKWLVLSLLIGNLLMIAIASANPLYSQAVLQHTLTEDLNDDMIENNRYPGTIRLNKNVMYYDNNVTDSIASAKQIYDNAVSSMNVPSLVSVINYNKTSVRVIPDVEVQGLKSEMMVQISSYSNLEDHIQIKHGQMYSREIKNNVIEVIVNEKTFVEKNLALGEELTVSNIITDENGNAYKMRIVGIFENKEVQDPFWLSSPSQFSNVYLMDQELFIDLIADPGKGGQTYNIVWHTVLDYTKIKTEQVSNMLSIAQNSKNAMKNSKSDRIFFYFEDTLENFVPKSQKLNTTIIVLQVPIFLLLAAFIFMVSRQMLEMEQNEISVFKSRGASKGQIIRLYFLQSILISTFGTAGGLPLGILICKLLGASNAFLEFVSRTALPVELSPKVWIFAAAAALFSICTMVLPVIKFSNITIVAHKRQKNRSNKHSWWKRIFLDVILLIISLYGLYQFRNQEAYLSEKVAEGAGLDPMLYTYSSLFMLGAGLLILRILPWMIQVIFKIGKKLWSPAIYASFLRIMRTNNNQGFLVVFLVLTVAMGIFNTRTARTINTNGEERIRYDIGADIVLMEHWSDNSQEVEDDTSGLTKLSYVEPDFSKYRELDGIKHVTKVLVDDNVSVSVKSGHLKDVTVLGIHTKEFGEVAWFKETLSAKKDQSGHWFEYLNAISQNADAILVSSNFKEIHGYEVGDIINYYNQNGDSVRGVIYGFIDYWPTYNPYVYTMGSDGIYRQTDHFLIVAHLSQLQSSWGITPYQVWIKTTDSSQFIYNYAREKGIKFEVFRDSAAELVALKNDPVFQGTNGILTIGFIVVLLLCATGFLIYWILSIQSRTLQFGIFRAMGMSKREVLTMLITEQIFISGASIVGGVFVGQIGSKLFVPLIQIAYSSADRVLPLEITSLFSDYVRLGAVIGLMIVICMIVLGILISKIKITQALKLGED